ncbi:MAG: DegV family protein [Eubacterium sp.]|nr:DegV family protein [Eubacterium sp.]
MYTIFTDTDTDITAREAKEYGYKLISMPYSINGKEVYPYVDFDTFDEHAFYQQLREGTLPNTSAINALNYKQYFEPEFAAGNDILYVHFSRVMSASFDAMDQAVADLKKKYPERNFYEVDTKGITIGSLNIVYEIGDMYKAGKSPEEILMWAETEVDKFAVYFFADDLKFFQRSGRVSGIAGFMGNMIGVRPILTMSSAGKMESVGKERGRMNAMKKLVSYMEELGEDMDRHRVIIAHADAPELAAKMMEMVTEHFGAGLDIHIGVVNPTAGSHCGPDTLGVSFHAKHR